MNDFTASNGHEILIEEERVRVIDAGGANVLDLFDYFDQSDMQALREFFQAEADERLGRWRSAKNPVWTAVVQDGSGVVLFRHDDGQREFSVESRETQLHRWSPELREVAREYFDAHPEPKPWHEAEADEIWRLTVNGVESAWVRRPEVWERISDGFLLRNAPVSKGITDGRRIFPEVAS
ncbi:hypothetical protein NS183_07925 [Microbacterium testaceum]|uniref:hypothetical protein n=1 Tax=Microbacterium testaceum TaxID=2033 RepID=UPI000734F7E0|nr:hypothetical protein [Microbacterium testaceum]KTS90698.1 hypothetical protein NS183_07925 [Microbacterium testaceum]